MGKIFVTSDLHLYHNRAFIYEPRGFSNVHDMNTAIQERWNNTVAPEDHVYVLGDLMLNDNDAAARIIKNLKGNIHIVCGNHDTAERCNLYSTFWNVVEIEQAIKLDFNGYHFFMTHYPCFTGNLEKESLKKCTCNLFGHTHQQTNFYQDIPFMYHVGVDSHNCTPVLLDEAICDMKEKVKECLNML